MADQNFPDNVLYEMDNLPVLRGMNSETVDLIATDPPFNTKRNRSGTAGFYEDRWKWGDTSTPPEQWKWNEVHPIWLDEIKDDNPALYEVIQATRDYSTQAPTRTDLGDPAAPLLPPVFPIAREHELSHAEMHDILVDKFGLQCWGCRFEAPDERYLELDHIDPKSSGGSNHLDNRALLCRPCNQKEVKPPYFSWAMDGKSTRGIPRETRTPRERHSGCERMGKGVYGGSNQKCTASI